MRRSLVSGTLADLELKKESLRLWLRYLAETSGLYQVSRELGIVSRNKRKVPEYQAAC